MLATLIVASAVTLGTPVGHIRDAQHRYGHLRPDYSWPNHRNWLVHETFGPWKLYVNKDLVGALRRVEYHLDELGLMDEIQQFWGCYNPRSIAGRDSPSAHAYGLACDFHQHGEHWSKAFIKVWETEGFCWGGKFPNRDTMHFSYSWECQGK